MKAATCSAITRAGSPCTSPVVAGLGHCYVHAPELAEARREAARRGGRARSNRARAQKQMPEAMSPAELEGLLALTLRAVLAGRVVPGVGNCVANLARAAVAVREATAIEERIAELEIAAGLRQEGR
jgi:hypothetical protein